jgi:3-oxosteroid 1-dehydrogenase
MPDASLSKKYSEGFLIKGTTLADLAARCQLDPSALRATVDRFNALADVGVDEDFDRGKSATDRYYADPRVKPNPTLRALKKGPFYAIRVYPGDLGTKGGLVTDAHARVLNEHGEVIEGLYAAGNTSAAVMGPTYPGAGGTIGPALTFGFLAAEHAAGFGAPSV